MSLKISLVSNNKESSANFFSKSVSVFESELSFSIVDLEDSDQVTLTNTNVIVFDYDSTKLGTFDFIRAINRQQLKIPIIIIATQISESEFNDLLHFDIYAYIEKDHVMNYVLANYLYDIKKAPDNHAAS